MNNKQKNQSVIIVVLYLAQLLRLDIPPEVTLCRNTSWFNPNLVCRIVARDLKLCKEPLRLWVGWPLCFCQRKLVELCLGPSRTRHKTQAGMLLLCDCTSCRAMCIWTGNYWQRFIIQYIISKYWASLYICAGLSSFVYQMGCLVNFFVLYILCLLSTALFVIALKFSFPQVRFSLGCLLFTYFRCDWTNLVWRQTAMWFFLKPSPIRLASWGGY